MTIVAAWVITVPVSALLAATIYWVMFALFEFKDRSRANFRMQRLFIDAPLSERRRHEANAGSVQLSRQRAAHGGGCEPSCSSMAATANGRRVSFPTAQTHPADATEQTRPQPAPCDLHYLFAPLKVGRMDYLVQKAVEMGAGLLQPVMTQHVQGKITNLDKLRANVIEAAEQCGILGIPDVAEPMKLADLLRRWPKERRIIYLRRGRCRTEPAAGAG